MTETAAATAATDGRELAAAYRSFLAGAPDEMVDRDGFVRSHWQPLLNGIAAMTPKERRSATERLSRRVLDAGIAYDIFADPTARAQRWQLDFVPLMISADEWRWLEGAVRQRARLMSLLLDDLYGRQEMMRQGLIPPELIYWDRAYLPATRGIVPEAGGLMFYAVDLARDPQGYWRVIDNHTETLAGIGYALANRVAHTHIAGDLFNQLNAVRLASHFQAVQEMLGEHAGRKNARTALLTPGPAHQDYFSHSYVARYLGLMLVEGNDLRARGNGVWLKTLEGLKEIDLIVRCIEGTRADPLELDGSGFLGPAGLVSVCRGTPKLCANAIGTAIVQNRALAAYLPAVANALLGEALSLPDADRLWLGDPTIRQRVLGDLQSYSVRIAQEGTGRPGSAASALDTRDLSRAERQRLEADIALNGARLIAETRQEFSTTPSLISDTLVPKPFAVRLFATRVRDDYIVMPGGLAMTVDPRRAAALTAPDNETHDVWVLSDSAPRPHVSLWAPTLQTARIERSQRVIQSRVADNLFWLGRYAERTDWTLRVLRSALRRVEEDSGPATGQRAAIRTMELLLDGTPLPAPAKSTPAATLERARIEQVAQTLVRSKGVGRALPVTIEGLFRNAYLVRDRLSLEAWQTLSRFRPGDMWSAAIAAARPAAMLDQVEEGLSFVAAFNGLMHENMTRNFGWSFIALGRRLERAYNLAEATLGLFEVRPEAEEERSHLLLLLELADSFITYRSRYRLDPMLALTLDLLMLDETNPRSLAFQLAEIDRHLRSLPAGTRTDEPEDRRLSRVLLESVRATDLEAIEADLTGRSLAAELVRPLELLPELSDALSRHYFNLTEDAPQALRAHPELKP